MNDYPVEYYRRLRSGSRSSARIIIPLVLDLTSPRSIVDVGCGTGTWLTVFEEHGINDILGIDRESVTKQLLEISPDQFLRADLTKNVSIDRTFDLVLCLEVAEHLPETSAETLVSLLTALAPVVLFSAAVPFQGGRHHVNEQWPDYWNQLFKREEYIPVDCIRKHLWSNNSVEWWYAQNTLVFVREQRLSEYPNLVDEREHTHEGQLALIHPENYRRAHWNTRISRLQNNLKNFLSADDRIALIDGNSFERELTLPGSTLRLFEREGEYTGPPADSTAAIEELNYLRDRGATVLVVAWPAFWWLEYYSRFANYLDNNFRQVVDTPDHKVFAL